MKRYLLTTVLSRMFLSVNSLANDTLPEVNAKGGLLPNNVVVEVCNYILPECPFANCLTIANKK